MTLLTLNFPYILLTVVKILKLAKSMRFLDEFLIFKMILLIEALTKYVFHIKLRSYLGAYLTSVCSPSEPSGICKFIYNA